MASIKELLRLSVKDLEAMDDATLKARCEPYLRVVHCEVKEDEGSSDSGAKIVNLESGASIQRKRRSSSAKPKPTAGESLKQQMEALAKQYGVDMSGSKLPTNLK
jgi:hypothetical protein